jgi:meso-butanediol dehydrogenase/(S,S)-butanediol dehydrogenase/diacetyl reductase
MITGAGAGIGAACARLFLQEGARVVLIDRDAQALEASCAALHAQFDPALLLSQVLDTADLATPELATQAALSSFGQIDVLVNNAAMRNYLTLEQGNREQWNALLQVNLIGSAEMCAAVLPHMRRRNSGSIVNVSSCYALTGRKGMMMYDASKAALLALTRTVAHEGAPNAVRCNAVCPGSTLTDFHLKRATAAGKSMAQISTERDSNSLLARWARPEEIAWPIVWLASDEASFITGAVLPVDGGLTAM